MYMRKKGCDVERWCEHYHEKFSECKRCKEGLDDAYYKECYKSRETKRTIDVIKKCLWCGREFIRNTRAKFCGPSCYKKYKYKFGKKKKCKNCGEEFIPKGSRAKYCNKPECQEIVKKNAQEKKKEWNRTHKDKVLEMNKRYCAKHKDRVLETQRRYHAKKKALKIMSIEEYEAQNV